MMNFKNVLEQFVGGNSQTSTHSNFASSGSQFLNQVNQNQHVSNIKSKASSHKGLLGGLAAGGLMALLVSNKSARKVAGKAAKYGGAALLGGAAYKVYQKWQENAATQSQVLNTENSAVETPVHRNNLKLAQDRSHAYQLTLLKAMIASSKADGHIDAKEQKRIFEAVAKMALSSEAKGLIFDFMSNPISISEIVDGVNSMEEKTEVYFMSCLVGDIAHPAERAHLDELARALALPSPLVKNIEAEACQTMQVESELS